MKYNQVKFEKAVPILPKESLAEITKTKVWSLWIFDHLEEPYISKSM